MTRPGVQIAVEGGGWMVSCPCLWLRWAEMEIVAREVKREHEKKCKVLVGGDD